MNITIEKKYDFDELEDEIRDRIIEEILQWNTEIDHLSFQIARRNKYNKEGEIIR
jgi:hypothetical protein